MIPLDELKRLSREATPANWYVSFDREIYGSYTPDSDEGEVVVTNIDIDRELIVAMRNNIDAMIERTEKLERVASCAILVMDDLAHDWGPFGCYADLYKALEELESK